MTANVGLSRPERTASAVDTAVDTIRLAILTRSLLPGEQLRQEELARKLELSRVPVREALSRLEGEGLAVRVPNVGYFVAKLDANHLSQLYRMRAALEGELLRSCGPVSAHGLRRLEKWHASMREAVDAGDATTLLGVNREFHFAIFALAKLPLIEREIERLWTMSAPYQLLSMSDRTRRSVVPEQHAQMLEALRSHDNELLVELHARHRAITEEGVLDERS